MIELRKLLKILCVSFIAILIIARLGGNFIISKVNLLFETSSQKKSIQYAENIASNEFIYDNTIDSFINDEIDLSSKKNIMAQNLIVQTNTTQEQIPAQTPKQASTQTKTKKTTTSQPKTNISAAKANTSVDAQTSATYAAKPNWKRKFDAMLPPVDGNKVTVTGQFFKDRDLEIAVRIALDKYEGNLTREDLARVTKISAREEAIEDLTGIENLISLRELYLSSNGIKDITPIKNMKTLQTVSFGGNNISSIEPLNNLTNITVADFRDNSISDISVLRNLTKLETVYVCNNKITNISAISDLQHVTRLLLKGNAITDYSPVASYYDRLVYKDFEMPK